MSQGAKRNINFGYQFLSIIAGYTRLSSSDKYSETDYFVEYQMNESKKNVQDSLRIVEKIDYLTKYQSKPDKNERRVSNSQRPSDPNYNRKSDRDYFLNNDGSLMSQLNSTSNYDKNRFFGLLSTLQEECHSMRLDTVNIDNLCSKVRIDDDLIIKSSEAKFDSLNIEFNTINEFNFDNVQPLDVNVRGELSRKEIRQVDQRNYNEMNFRNSQTSEESQSRIRNLMLNQERIQKHETDFSERVKKLKDSLHGKSFKELEEQSNKQSIRISYDYTNSSDFLPNELMDKVYQLEDQQSLKILNSYKNLESVDNKTSKDSLSQFREVLDNYQSNYNSNQSKNWEELKSLNYYYGNDKNSNKANSKKAEDKVQLNYSMSTDEKEDDSCMYEIKRNQRCQSDHLNERNYPPNIDLFAVKSMKEGGGSFENLSGRELEKNNNIFGLIKHKEEPRESMDFNSILAKAQKKESYHDQAKNAFKKNKPHHSKQLDEIADEYDEIRERKPIYIDYEEGDKKLGTNSDNHLMNMDLEFSKRKVNKSEKNSFMKEAFFSFKPEEDI